MPNLKKYKMFKPDYHTLKNSQWYRQAGAIGLYYIDAACRGITKDIGPHWLFSVKKEYGQNGFDINVLVRLGRQIIDKQLKDPKFLRNKFKNWTNFKKKVYQLAKILDKTDLKSIADNKLIKLQKDFAKLNQQLWSLPILIDIFDYEGEKVVEEYLARYPELKLTSEEIRDLLTPNEMTFGQQERLGLLNLVLKINKNNRIEKYTREIQQHAKKYFFYKNDWSKVWEPDEDYFAKKINDELRNLKKAKREIKEIRDYQKNLIKRKQKIYKTKKIPQELKIIFKFFELLTFWRDVRKTDVQLINHYYYQFIKEFNHRTGIEEKYLLYLEPSAITSVKFIKDSLPELKRRRSGCVYVFNEKEKYKWVSGFGALKVIKLMDELIKKQSAELKGNTAYPGLVRGKAKVIKTTADFKKMKKGDILVAPMTRPEYLPLMKIASAIITDEGGITCHAAIVSRELKVPCVIGAQTATDVLKDDDRVEVDAGKGIIKKL